MGVSVIILITFLGIGFGLSGSSPSTGLDEVANQKPRLNQTASTASTSTEKTVIVDSALGNYTHAAVAADGGAICAKIGRYILLKTVSFANFANLNISMTKFSPKLMSISTMKQSW